MRLPFQLALIIALLVALTVQPTAPAHAQSQDQSASVALVIVVDNSGSMDRNDPDQLSFAAARLIYEAADSNDQIGVICFGTDYATMLPLAPVGDATARRAAAARLTKGACQTGGNTVMGAAINAAVATLAEAAPTQRYLLLLTDGEPNDPYETFAAIDRARQQQIPIIPLLLYPGSLSAEARQFQEQLRQRGFDPRVVTNSQDLIAEFATVYAQLKPDRYVTRLGRGGPGEMRISSLQQVQRVLFVLKPDQLLYENDREIGCASGATRCVLDVENKFALLSIEATPVEGIWRVRSMDENAVAITRANFRPRLAYPPVGDTAQPGYFLPGRASPLIIAELEGVIPDSAPVTINGDAGRRASGSGQTYIFAGVPTLKTATVRLGPGDTPLVLEKVFSLLPVPDPEHDLPRLEPANPDANGKLTLDNDIQFTLAVRIAGNPALTSQLTVRAVIFDGGAGKVVYGPASLFAQGDLYRSTEQITIQPGITYHAVIWMEAVRERDRLRYGDLLTLDLRAGGQIIVKGLSGQSIRHFDGRAIPLTIDVTEANTTVNLTAHLEWNNYPAGADVANLFGVQLDDSRFAGRGKQTRIVLRGPEDLCDLPEGNYEAAIVFTSPDGLPVNPSRIPVSGRIGYGNVDILTTTAVQLGHYCSLPGLLNFFCLPLGGNENREPIGVDLRVPACLNNANITAELQIADDPGTTVKIGALEGDGEQATLYLVMDTVAPQDPLRDFAVRRVFTGNLLVGRRDMPERADTVNVTYTKFSTVDVFWPGLGRWGNLTGLIGVIILGVAIWRFIFGPTKKQRERERMRSSPDDDVLRRRRRRLSDQGDETSQSDAPQRRRLSRVRSPTTSSPRSRRRSR